MLGKGETILHKSVKIIVPKDETWVTDRNRKIDERWCCVGQRII